MKTSGGVECGFNQNYTALTMNGKSFKIYSMLGVEFLKNVVAREIN